jgi:hypothetical protein|tara:strand:+ start:1363 stop:1749 length:387 start_codon:yes stop_codon:yes gene_type:complete
MLASINGRRNKMKYYSLRIKLDDIIINEDFEKKVLENIRYCRKLVGKQFRVIFWNENLTGTQCKEFVERNEHLLFEIHTQITKRFQAVWYLITSNGDKSRWRYKSDGDILDGISSYIKLIKHMKGRNR